MLDLEYEPDPSTWTALKGHTSSIVDDVQRQQNEKYNHNSPRSTPILTKKFVTLNSGEQNAVGIAANIEITELRRKMPSQRQQSSEPNTVTICGSDSDEIDDQSMQYLLSEKAVRLTIADDEQASTLFPSMLNAHVPLHFDIDPQFSDTSLQQSNESLFESHEDFGYRYHHAGIYKNLVHARYNSPDSENSSEMIFEQNVDEDDTCQKEQNLQQNPQPPATTFTKIVLGDCCKFDKFFDEPHHQCVAVAAHALALTLLKDSSEWRGRQLI